MTAQTRFSVMAGAVFAITSAFFLVLDAHSEDGAAVDRVSDAKDVQRSPRNRSNLARGKKTFDMTCAACHEPGISGAPRVGDKTAWAPRLRKGKETLIQHALAGLGYMPPKGGNAMLSDQDVAGAVEYMLSRLK